MSVADLDLISIVAHELRSPLTAIKGYSSMLATMDADNLTDKQRHFIHRVSQSSERMGDLIDKLLDLGIIESGNLKLGVVPTAIEPIVNDIVEDLSRTTAARLAVSLDKKRLPIVLADPARLHQILTNLLDNAIKYSPEGGGVHIVFKHEGDEVTVTVADEGVGIPADQVNKLFTKFGRLYHPSTIDRPGSGLGLYIVKRLVEAQDGRIWLSSKEGKGSKFSFSLPVAKQLPLLD